MAHELPGRYEFRVRGGGEVYLTAVRVKSTLDIGCLSTVSVEHAPAGAILERRNAGTDSDPAAKAFLYPPTQ